MNRFVLFILFGVFCYHLSYSQIDSIYWLKAKAEISIEQLNSIEKYNAQIRYNMADSLWISFTGFMGIEGMRVMVKNDSVFVHNKIDNEFLKFYYNEPNLIIPFEISMKDWNIILNQITLKNIPQGYIQKDKTNYTKIDENLIKDLKFNSEGQLVFFEIVHPATQRKLRVSYSNFQKNNDLNILCAMNRNLEISNIEFPTKIFIAFSSIFFNQPLNMPFTLK